MFAGPFLFCFLARPAYPNSEILNRSNRHRERGPWNRKRQPGLVQRREPVREIQRGIDSLRLESPEHDAHLL